MSKTRDMTKAQFDRECAKRGFVRKGNAMSTDFPKPWTEWSAGAKWMYNIDTGKWRIILDANRRVIVMDVDNAETRAIFPHVVTCANVHDDLLAACEDNGLAALGEAPDDTSDFPSKLRDLAEAVNSTSRFGRWSEWLRAKADQLEAAIAKAK